MTLAYTSALVQVFACSDSIRQDSNHCYFGFFLPSNPPTAPVTPVAPFVAPFDPAIAFPRVPSATPAATPPIFGTNFGSDMVPVIEKGMPPLLPPPKAAL